MSYVFASPEWVAAAASDLASIGSTINAASAAAAMPTSAVMAAGADDVSAVIAALFGSHAQAYQQLSAQAAMFHEQFVQLMSSGANLYAGAEAANATPMQHGAAPSHDVAMATAAAAQSMNAGAANRVGAAVGAARSGASLFGPPAATALAPAAGSAGLFGSGGGGGAGVLCAQAGVAPGADVSVAQAGTAQAFAPGFFGPGAALAAANGQAAAAQPARGSSEGHSAPAVHAPHAEPSGSVGDGDHGGWLHGEGAQLSGRALHDAESFFAAGDRGAGLFGHSGAGGSGVLGVAAPA